MFKFLWEAWNSPARYMWAFSLFSRISPGSCLAADGSRSRKEQRF